MGITNPVWLALAAFMWFVAGFHVAKLSREVYRRWEDPEDNTIATFFGLRIILFPLNSFNKIWGRRMEWFMIDVGVLGPRPQQIAYTTISMFFWPIRIAWFLLMATIMVAFVPLISIVAAVMWRTVRGTIQGILHTIAPSEPAPR